MLINKLPLLEKNLAFLGRRWGFRKGARVFAYLRKYCAKYYLHRSDSVTVITDYDQTLAVQIDRSTYLGGVIYWHGGKSTPGFRLLPRILKPEHVFFDIGANQGEATLIAAKRLSEGKVFSFEPVHDLYLKLCRNIELNHFSNVIALQRALAKEKGQLPIYTSMDVDIHSSWNEGLSSLFQSDYRDTLVQTVDVTTVDLIVSDSKLDRLDVVKIDVEGAELQVWQGAKAAFERFYPKVIMEINPSALKSAGTSAEELVQYITSAGYQVNLIHPTGQYEPFSVSNFQRAECDVVCLPVNKKS